jgi:hypothetical protein
MQWLMNRAKTAFALLVVFFAGCAAERLLVVPPARAGTSPQRWEYQCPEVSFHEKVEETAVRMGKEGWELAAAQDVHGWVVWCFKRPLP